MSSGTFYKTLHNELSLNHCLVLMCVIHSSGSSPGRQGFKMLVSTSGLLCGSIGGGPMEHKLVEWCKANLNQPFSPFTKRQIHQSNIGADKSGMNCSGEQTIAFYYITPSDQLLFEHIISINNGVFHAHEKGLDFSPSLALSKKIELNISNPTEWSYKEDFDKRPILHIIGSGHVGLALCHMAERLNFRIYIYDNRKNIGQIKSSEIKKKYVDDYKNISQYLPDHPNSYVVLMSFGFRTDKIILEQLLKRRFKYLGMMGSSEKIKQIYQELTNEGVDPHLLSKVNAPIGLQISSKTPEEIAISVLAQIIQIKNAKHVPAIKAE